MSAFSSASLKTNWTTMEIVLIKLDVIAQNSTNPYADSITKPTRTCVRCSAKMWTCEILVLVSKWTNPVNPKSAPKITLPFAVREISHTKINVLWSASSKTLSNIKESAKSRAIANLGVSDSRFVGLMGELIKIISTWCVIEWVCLNWDLVELKTIHRLLTARSLVLKLMSLFVVIKIGLTEMSAKCVSKRTLSNPKESAREELTAIARDNQLNGFAE